MSEPEPETSTEPETENVILHEQEAEEVYPEPEGDWRDTPWPEPEPNWSVAFKTWGSAWDIHVYFIGSIFLGIAFITIFSLCFYIRSRHALRQGVLTFSLQCLLLHFSLLRSLSLFIDPYHTKNRVHPIASNAIWSVSMPALTASFSVLLLVLLDTTKMTLGPPRFQRLSVILRFTACHFLIVFISDGAYLLKAYFKPLLLLCRLLFILYGLVLGIGYCYSAWTVYNKCKAGAIDVEENTKIYRIVKIAAVGSATAFAIAFSHIYAASSDFGMYSDVKYVDAWDWWIFQSCLRLQEIIACCVVLTVAFRNPLSEECVLMRWISKYTHRKPSPSGEVKTSNIAPSKYAQTHEETAIEHIHLPMV